jgi:hypothetical protein
MTGKKRGLAAVERNLYLASRTAGDLNALKRGRLTRRVARRYERRTLLRVLSKFGL